MYADVYQSLIPEHKKRRKLVKIKAVECQSCGDVIFSRTDEDFRECSCGSVNASGGQTHFKAESVPNAEHKVVEVNLNLSMEDLYDDWDQMTDNYGVISI